MNSALLRFASLAAGLAATGALMSVGITSEMPIGNLEGVLTMEENGKPLPNAEIFVQPIPDANGEVGRTRFLETDAEGKFSLKGIYAGAYVIEATTKAHTVNRRIIQVTQGDPTLVTLKAAPMAPYLDLYASNHVFTPNETPRFEAKGFFEKGDLEVDIFKLNFDEVVKKGNLYEAFSSFARANDKTDPSTLGTKVRSTVHKVTERDVEGVFVETLKPEALPEGMYWVAMRGAGLKAGTWLLVSKIGLVGKSSGKETLAFVTDLESGRPISNVQVGTIQNGTFAAKGNTNANGVVQLPGVSSRVPLVAMTGDSKAFVGFYRNEQSAKNLRVVAYTDRPIYRPGDQVQFKGIVRKVEGQKLILPASSPVEVELQDSDGEVVDTIKTTLSQFGTYSGSFNINREAENGQFILVSKTSGIQSSAFFSVASYRKPTYQITVTPEKSQYVLGDHLRFTVDTQYYFGGAVKGAKIEASLYREPDWYDEEWAEDYGDDGYGGGEFLEEVKATSDANGKATFNFASVKGESPEGHTNYVYRVYVSVADDAGKYYDAEGKTKVARGNYDLGIRSANYMTSPNSPVDFNIYLKDLDGKPVSTKVEIQSARERWDGKSTLKSEVKTESVQVDSSGFATTKFEFAKPGYYTIVASTNDNKGRRISAETSMYVTGDGFEAPAPWPSLDLKLDKKLYKAGETAVAMIQTDRPGGTALVTVESEGILQHQTVELKENSTTLNLPVGDSYTPNVFVSVSYIRNKQFASNSSQLRVKLGPRELKVKVEPEQPKYEPGDTARYKVTTTTSNGTPTQAEVSVGVVDESIYAIAKDNFDLAQSLYPNRYNEVETQYSFPDLYLDGGDKAPSTVQVRRIFKDTAYWNPSVTTDTSGTAIVEVKLPDNLTEWRATARAISVNGEAGQGTGSLVASKDLMVRIEAPTFVVQGDEQTFKAVITNQTGKAADVHLQLDSIGCDFTGDRNRKVNVADGATQTIEFLAKPTTPGDAKFIAKAWVDGGPNDGVEQVLQVKPFGKAVTTGVTGKVVTGGTFELELPSETIPGYGRVRLNLAPSLAMNLIGPLDDLIDYPYGCVEQTMSRFMPAAVVSKTLTELKLPAPSRAPLIPQIVADGYSRLAKMQHSDGSWGWWEYDNGDPEMTAYVMEGIHRARSAGFAPKSVKIEDAIEWMTAELKKAEPTTNQRDEWIVSQRKVGRAYLEYALALHRPENVSPLLKPLPNDASPSVIALRARTLRALGRDNSEVVGRLVQAATKSGSLAHWQDSWSYGLTANAACFQALVEANPDHPLVPMVINYFLAQKRGNSWYSTRDTSAILVSVSGYLSRKGEGFTACDAIVKVNGVERSRVSFGGVAPGSQSIDIPIKDLQIGKNTFEIVRSNEGPMYYGANVEYVLGSTGSIPEDKSAGLSITRTYHKFSSELVENGTTVVRPTIQSITSAQAGDILEVRLQINNDRPREFLMLEDSIPAGCRITERDDIDSSDWSYWWSKTVVRDDKISFFMRNLDKGTFEVIYRMRAELPGKTRALPTRMYNMYDPAQNAWSSSGELEIRPK